MNTCKAEINKLELKSKYMLIQSFCLFCFFEREKIITQGTTIK